MDHQVVCTIKFLLRVFLNLIDIEGYYGPPQFRGRGYFRRGGYGQGGDQPEFEGYNGYRGGRGGRGGRGFRRGSGRRPAPQNEKFVLLYQRLHSLLIY